MGFDLVIRGATVVVPGHREAADIGIAGGRIAQVQGWPRFVIRRGQVVLADGEITGRPGDGEWLRRTAQVRMSKAGE